MKMELTEGSETSAYIKQTPGNYPKGNLLYSVHGESLKSRKLEQFLCERNLYITKYQSGRTFHYECSSASGCLDSPLRVHPD